MVKRRPVWLYILSIRLPLQLLIVRQRPPSLQRPLVDCRGAPKVFFRYFYVNSETGEKSGVMLAETTWTAGA